jgi:hypothetical protein
MNKYYLFIVIAIILQWTSILFQIIFDNDIFLIFNFLFAILLLIMIGFIWRRS